MTSIAIRTTIVACLIIALGAGLATGSAATVALMAQLMRVRE